MGKRIEPFVSIAGQTFMVLNWSALLNGKRKLPDRVVLQKLTPEEQEKLDFFRNDHELFGVIGPMVRKRLGYPNPYGDGEG